MLAPDYLDHAPDRLVLLWQQVEDDILRDVARRIGKMDKVTATANWQLWRYQQTEALRNDVVKLLAKYTGKSETAIRKLLLQAATEAMERNGGQLPGWCQLPVTPQAVSHEDFKRLTQQARVMVRTGECTPYANVILVAGVTF